MPESHRETGEHGCPQRRGFHDRGADDAHTREIGLELHQQAVGHGTAVDAHLGRGVSRIGRHGAYHVVDLEGDRFERRPGDVRGGRAARDADDRAAGIGVPVGSAQSRQRRYQIDAARIFDRCGQRFRIGRRGEEFQPVAQPLDDRTAHEDASFERIGRLAAELPRHGGQQVVGRGVGPVARIEHDEASLP